MKIKKILLFSLIIFISHTIIASASTGSGSVTVTVNPPASITAICALTHYNCIAGTSGSQVESSPYWLWGCNGLYGGGNVQCSQLMGTPINAICASTHYNCNAGTSVNNTEGYQKWQWGCNGLYGGTNKPYPSCSQLIPPPTNLTSSCPSPGTSASLSWTLPSGYTLSYLRIIDNMTSVVIMVPEDRVDSGPSFSFTTIPGHEYLSWVHTRLPSGASSSEIYSSFNCIPVPSGTLTPPSSSCTITAGNSSCNVPLTWTTANPVGTSAITSNYPSANTILANGNSGTNQPIAVPYLSSPRTFYLYHNAILLAPQITATSSCISNTHWDGSICAVDTNLVSTSVNTGGTISPTSKIVNYGATTTFTVTPNSGYSIGSVSGCSGSLSGNTYTTGPITATCTVTATFSLILLVPTVETTPVNSIYQTTATGGGNVTSNGGATVTVGGIVWGTALNPTTDLSTKTVHSNWANYSAWEDAILGLTANTTYYVRAYATNSVGTSYGNEVSFKTVSCPSNYHWGESSCVINAPTTTFTVNNATTATIFKGKSATLRWDSSATSCTSTGLGFDVSTHLPTSTSGSIVVSPLITTTYTLACTNDSGTVNNTVTTKVITLNIEEN